MKYDLGAILHTTIMHRCLITALLFMLPLHKRRRFLPRAALCVAAGLLCNPLLEAGAAIRRAEIGQAFHADSRLETLLAILPWQAAGLAVYLLFLTLAFYICCELRPSKAFYGALCALLSQDLTFSLLALGNMGIQHFMESASPLYLRGVLLLLDLLLYGLLYYFCARKLPRDGDYPIHYTLSNWFIVAIILIERVMNAYSKAIYDHKPTSLLAISLLYNALLSAIVLYLQVLYRREQDYAVSAATEAQLRHSQETQYRSFQASTDIINHRIHDLKHLAAALQLEGDGARKSELLRELTQQIDTYDSRMDTGNATLDTILSNTWSKCIDRRIHWTCLADGDALGFVDPVDLYVMLGNALDNAVEGAEKGDDPDKRFLSVNIWKKGGLSFVRIENYCAEAPDFQDGAPRTNKPDPGHGFGVRSIRSVCERYHGACEMHYSENTYLLSAVFPAPAEAAAPRTQ